MKKTNGSLAYRPPMRMLFGAMNEIGEFLEEIAVRTTAGTPLFGSTRKAFEDCLDAYYYGQRTGVMVMEEVQRLPIAKIAERAGVGVEDKVKIMSQFEKEYDAWIANRPASSPPTVDDEFKKEIKGQLHSILSKAGNKMKLDRLVSIYAVNTGRDLNDETMDTISRNVRAYASIDPAFQVGRGGFASVYRLHDTKGKDTRVSIEESGSNLSRGERIAERYTSRVRELGYASKEQFDRAKASGARTFNDLKAWISKHPAA